MSHHRLRGIRIFDISDIENPDYVANVQTCRGSHTHTVLKDPNDDENVYIYVSGSAPVRPAEELEGVPTVCASLGEALEALDADRDFLRKGDVFSDDQIDGYIELKQEEVTTFLQAPHPVEFEMYYSA